MSRTRPFLPVLAALVPCQTAWGGSLGSDPNAFMTHVGTITSGTNSMTVESAVYAPGTVIGGDIPTSAMLWTYAYQVFDNGITFDRLRIDSTLGGFALNYGVSATLGQPGGIAPSVIHHQNVSVLSVIPSPDYSPAISGLAFTASIYYTSPVPPSFGVLFVANGAEPPTGTVAIGFGDIIAPIPSPSVLPALLCVAAAGGARRRRFGGGASVVG